MAVYMIAYELHEGGDYGLRSPASGLWLAGLPLSGVHFASDAL